MLAEQIIEETDLENIHRDEIAEHLPNYVRATYEQFGSLELRENYNMALAKVLRWQGKRDGQTMNPNFKENDLQHVTGLLDWANEVEQDYPRLWHELTEGRGSNWKDLMGMLIIHDSGEIVAGDLVLSDTIDPAVKKRHKKKEAKGAYYLIGRNLSPERSSYVKHLYERFERRERTDKLALLGHVLDKGQAAQNVAVNSITFNLNSPDFEFQRHFVKGQGSMLNYSEILVDLISAKAKVELQDFLNEKVIRHFENIEAEETKPAQDFLRNVFKKTFAGSGK